MRRLGTLFCLTVAVTLPVAAQAGTYGMAGCGLGAVVFGDDQGMIQILASTTNAMTCGNQTWAITSGTSECSDGSGTAALDQESFLKTNRAHVMRDAATGQGEYLATFATLLGCEASAQPKFFEMAQKNHKELFTESSTKETLVKVKKEMAKDDALKASCARI